jgi:hypothetical protein
LVKIGMAIEVGVTYSGKRRPGGFGTSDNDEQPCDVVSLASRS